MNKTWLSGLLAGLLLLLPACGGETAPSSAPSPSPSETQPVESVPAETPPVESPVPARVSIDFASEELLADESAYDCFIDDESEYQVMAAFTAQGSVTELHYVRLAFEDSEGDISLYVDGDLYTADRLTPERPLVIGLAVNGLIPDRGISFVDETGATRTFTINMSGKDGSLLLVEEEFADHR